MSRDKDHPQYETPLKDVRQVLLVLLYGRDDNFQKRPVLKNGAGICFVTAISGSKAGNQHSTPQVCKKRWTVTYDL